MITIEAFDLAALRLRWPDIARLQQDVPHEQDLHYLADLAGRGARAVLARQGWRLLGSYLHIPATEVPALAGNAAFIAELAMLEIGLGELSVATHIYVDGAVRGQGLSVRLAAARARDALVRGMTHGVLFAAQTPEIRSWAGRWPGILTTGVADADGRAICLVPLDGLRAAATPQSSHA